MKGISDQDSMKTPEVDRLPLRIAVLTCRTGLDGVVERPRTVQIISGSSAVITDNLCLIYHVHKVAEFASGAA